MNKIVKSLVAVVSLAASSSVLAGSGQMKGTLFYKVPKNHTLRIIGLTDTNCRKDGDRVIYATLSTGEAVVGCYHFDQEAKNVLVEWNGYGKASYPLDGFFVTPYAQSLVGK